MAHDQMVKAIVREHVENLAFAEIWGRNTHLQPIPLTIAMGITLYQREISIASPDLRIGCTPRAKACVDNTPDWVLSWEVSVRQIMADDGNAGTADDVSWSEVASLEHGNTHGPEKAWVDQMDFRAR